MAMKKPDYNEVDSDCRNLLSGIKIYRLKTSLFAFTKNDMLK